jgi:ribosome-binding factor A
MNPDQKGGSRRQSERATEIVAREAALFITREAGTESLITVIDAKSMSHGERIGVFVSVFPEEKARAAISFLERQRHAFSEYLKSHTRLRIPRVDFLLENGEHSGGEMPKN